MQPLQWYGSFVDSGMPDKVYAFGASLLLALPIVRHIMSWMGVVPASKDVMLNVLSKASGGALPEGIAGIFTGASRCIESSTSIWNKCRQCYSNYCCSFCMLLQCQVMSDVGKSGVMSLILAIQANKQQ